MFETRNKHVLELQERWIAGDESAMVELSSIIDAMAFGSAQRLIIYDKAMREEVALKSSHIVLGKFLDNRCFRVEKLGAYIHTVIKSVARSFKFPGCQEEYYAKQPIDGLLFIHEYPKIAVMLYNAVLFGPVVKRIDRIMGRRWCYDHAQELKHVFDMTRRKGKDEIKSLYNADRGFSQQAKDCHRTAKLKSNKG